MKGFHVRREAHWIVIPLFLAVAGCGGDSGTNGGNDNGNTNNGTNDGTNNGTTPVVTMDVTVGNGGNVFTPPDIQVSPGATVTWTWNAGGVGHNVTFASSAVSAPSATQPTGTFQVTMPTAAAVYNYECTIHPGMDGSVTVQ